jgi:hypothetical protein
MSTTGRAVYDPAEDGEGAAWADEREERRQGAALRRAMWKQERQDARDELRARVWLSADVSGQLRAVAAGRAGLSPEQVLAQLADRARVDDAGAVLDPFVL